MEFSNIEKGELFLVESLKVKNVHSVFINSAQHEHWKNLTEVNKETEFYWFSEKCKIALFPPYAMWSLFYNKKLISEHAHIWVTHGDFNLAHYEILEVRSNAGIFIRGKEEIGRYLFPDSKTLKEQLWTIDHK